MLDSISSPCCGGAWSKYFAALLSSGRRLSLNGLDTIRRTLGRQDQNCRCKCDWSGDFWRRDGSSLDCERPWIRVTDNRRSAATSQEIIMMQAIFDAPYARTWAGERDARCSA